MQSMCKKVICFDLDDTLYKEIEFVESGFRFIAESENRLDLLPKMMGWRNRGEDVFFNFNKAIGKVTAQSEYLKMYRYHKPRIVLLSEVANTLDELKNRGCVLGVITDGRGETQWNKIKALGLEKWLDHENIIISEIFGSEKTDERNFRYFVKRYPRCEYIYVGDNPKKDFVVANRLQWKTIMLKDDGKNIHNQDIEVENDFQPQYQIDSLNDILTLI